MDVEKITKINELARELKKHGIVDSFDEALKMAENLISKKDNGSYKDFEKDVKKNIESVMQEKKDTDKGLEREINIIKQQVSTLTTKMNEIIDEINKLNEKIEKVMTQPTKLTEQESNDKKDKAKHHHPRSGNYNPEDVSIEKFFYSGSGKKEKN